MKSLIDNLLGLLLYLKGPCDIAMKESQIGPPFNKKKIISLFYLNTNFIGYF